MSSKLSYKPLTPVATPRLATKATNEHRFWKKYQNSEIIESTYQTSSICSNGNDKGYMLFAHGRSISLFDTAAKEVIRKVEGYTYPVTACTLREDGMLMATGDEEGRIEVKDTKEKFNLRTFDNHKKRINCLDFHHHDLYSGGADMVLRLFDVAGGSVVHSYENAHSDYIKCVKGLENNHLLSGGYDGFIKLFDFRVHELPVMEFNHGNQVEWFDLFPSNMNFVACGEKKISSWDIRSSRPVYENENNKKLLTCVRVVSNGSRVMTSSYDCHLKVYKSDTFEVTYQEKMESPILCFDVSKNSQFIGLGLENKKIIMKSRVNTKDENASDNESEKEIEEEIGLWMRNNENKAGFAYNDKHFYRGIYGKPENYDIKFERNQNKKVSEYDKFLKKFQYKRALFTSISKKNMTIFLALIDEYSQRGCLDRVLKSLTENETGILLEFLSNLLHDIRYNETALSLLNKVAGKLFPNIDFQNDVAIENWNNVKDNISEEIETCQQLSKISGMLELIDKNSCIL